MVMEGLVGLVSNATNVGEFIDFRFSEEVHFEILQFTEDTMLICDGYTENLWSIKAILRGFKLASGLRVNLSKNHIYEVNLAQEVLQISSSFLDCKIGTMPFKFLGIPVGASLRRRSTWNSIVDIIKRIWKNTIFRLLTIFLGSVGSLNFFPCHFGPLTFEILSRLSFH